MRKPIESYDEMAKRLIKEEKIGGCEELIYFLLDRAPSLRKTVKSWEWARHD